jgi:hypothetical protein
LDVEVTLGLQRDGQVLHTHRNRAQRVDHLFHAFDIRMGVFCVWMRMKAPEKMRNKGEGGWGVGGFKVGKKES